MTPKDVTIFIFWLERFDETSAAIFITQLRRSGCRVKLVGIAGMQSKGEHGLALVPDLMIDQALALADRANCVVFPCSMTGLQRLQNDPRITDFLRRAERNHAQFLIGPTLRPKTQQSSSTVRPISPSILVAQVNEYPDDEHLVRFARELAHSLMANGKGTVFSP
jgi:hypothetical protein